MVPAGLRSFLHRYRMPLGVVAACVLLVGLGFHLRMPFDDSFITYRYAANLANGQGLVFNPGERVEGYTCFLGVVILSGIIAAGFDVVLWSQVLGGLAALGTVAVAVRLEALLGMPTVVWPRIVMPFALAACPAFALWAGSGMETSLFTLLVTLTLFLHVRSPGSVWSGLALAAATMTRPEGVLWGTAMGLDQLRRGRSGRWAWLAAAAAGFGPVY